MAFNNNYEPVANPTSDPVVIFEDEHEAPETQALKYKAIAGTTMYDARVVQRDIPDIIEDRDVVLRVTSTSASMESGMSVFFFRAAVTDGLQAMWLGMSAWESSTKLEAL
jgi:hypothetical protein